MRNLLIFLLCLSFGFINAQRKPKIKGNKSVVEVNEELLPYNKIQLEDDLRIRLERSEEYSYTVTADDNLIDILKFEVADSTLIVSSFYKITGQKELDILIRYNQLNAILLNDGEISSDETISTDEMKVELNGFARADLRLSNEITKLISKDNTKAELNIESDSLSVVMNDKSEAAIYAVSDGQYISLDDSAVVDLEGTSNTAEIKAAGNSKLKAQTAVAENASLSLSETAVARLLVNSGLNLSMSGSTKFYLYGDPQIQIKEFVENSELYKRSLY